MTTMNASDPITIEVHLETISQDDVPSEEEFVHWTQAALDSQPAAEIAILIVDEEESARLNELYRKKQGPTNVLSFTLSSPHQTDALFGDLIICAPLVVKEAREQNKEVRAHWAHLTVHGTLHLQGFDHVREEEAEVMEAREVEILRRLGFANPYE